MKNINNVIDFFNDFAKTEAETEVLKFKYDLSKYNNKIHEINAFYLAPYVSFMPKEPLDKEDIIDMGLEEIYSSPQKRPPRKLFKISEYYNNNFGKFWACFTTTANHSEFQSEILNTILFILEKNDEFKIASALIYSRHHKDGFGDKKHSWQHLLGNDKLNFSLLGNPTTVVKIAPPKKSKNGSELFEQDI